MSQKLIKHNSERIDKDIKTKNPDNAKVLFLPCERDISVYQQVENHVLKNIEKEQSCALVGRIRGQLLPYEILFARRKIPFYIDADLNIFESDAYNNLVDVLTVKADGWSRRWRDEVLRVINQILRYPLTKDKKATLDKMLRSKDTLQDDLNQFGDKTYNTTKKIHNRNLGDVLVRWYDEPNVVVALLIMAIMFHGFKKDFEKADEDVFYTDPPFSHLIDFAQLYPSDKSGTDQFLEDLEGVKNYGKLYSPNEKLDPAVRILISTAFRTKGREFDTVCVLDANSEHWPNKQATTEEELETERRLFYVVVTRTKKELIFTDAENSPSQYLNEMGLK